MSCRSSERTAGSSVCGRTVKRPSPVFSVLALVIALTMANAFCIVSEAAYTTYTTTVRSYQIDSDDGWIIDYVDRYHYETNKTNATWLINHTSNSTGGVAAYTSVTALPLTNHYNIAPTVTVHTYYTVRIYFDHTGVVNIPGAKYRQGQFNINTGLAAAYNPAGWSFKSEIVDLIDFQVLGQYKTEFNYSMVDYNSSTFRINFNYQLREGTGNSTDVVSLRFKSTCTFESSAYSSAMTQLNTNRPAFTVASVTIPSLSWRDVEIADYTPYAHQNASNLQIIADGIAVNESAADVLNDANTNFANKAQEMASVEDVLNNQADQDVSAIDFSGSGGMGAINTYPTSLNFWVSLIAAVPAAVGSFWNVIIFGFLIAFVLFILRLNRR